MHPPTASLTPETLAAHAPYVRALARALVLDRELAEDLSQDVLLAALEDGPRDGRATKAWLASTLRHLASKAFRSRARRGARERAVSRPESGVPSTAEILEREDFRRRLVEHVLALEEPVRSAMILRYLEDLPPRAVARRLGQPVETVRTRAKRGLALLRARLEADPSRGRAWRHLALLAGWRLPSLAPLPAACPAPGVCVSGVLLMSSKIVVASAVGLLLLGLLGLRFLPGGAAPAEPALAAKAEEPLPPASSASPAPHVEVGTREVLAASRPPPSPPPAAVPPTTGALLLVVRWHDGTPAEGVAARLHLPPPADFYRDTRDVRTGPDGTVLVEGLPPGGVSVILDRGQRSGARIEAGARAEVAITIPAGVLLSGAVRTRSGEPIEGARILVDRMGTGWDGHEMARSGPDGRYAIRALSPGLGWVTARAPLHAPSLQRQFLCGDVDVEGVDLVLEPTGAALEGRVLDRDGMPLDGAEVLLGAEDAYNSARMHDGSAGRVPAAQRATTDAQGRYSFPGAAPGTLPLQARAPGHAPWAGEVEVSAGATGWREIRLRRQGVVSGRVLDTAGAPIARAEIQANGPYGFASIHALSDAGGRFRLEGLPEGEVDVVVSATGRESLQERLRTAQGGELEWDAVLKPRPTIRGRLTCPGADFTGWRVTCDARSPEGEFHRAAATTDASGSFELEAQTGGSHDLRVFAPESYHFPVAVLEGVHVGGGEVRIPIDGAALAACSLQGRLVDTAGEPLPGLSLAIVREGTAGAPLLTAAADGRFSLAAMPPGRYVVSVSESGFVPYRSEPIELLPGDALDAGDLRVEAGGRIVVRLRLDPSSLDAQVSVQGELSGGGDRFTLDLVGDEAHSRTLAPGSYLVRLGARSGSLAARSARITVRAHQTATLDLWVEPGRVWRLDTSPAGTGLLTVKAFDAAGTVVVERSVERGAEVRLPSEAARVEVADGEGRTGSAMLAPGRGPGVLRVALE